MSRVARFDGDLSDEDYADKYNEGPADWADAEDFIDQRLCGDCWKYTDSYRKDKSSETGYKCQHFYECEAHQDVR